jgi:hypothetical protein
MNPRALDPTPLIRLAGLVLALAATVLATGCTTPKSITTDAVSFGNWPSDREPGTYAFERLPSQQARAPAQDKLETAAAAALQRAGFKPAASPAEADVLVVAGTRLTTVAGYYDPFYAPFGPRFYFSGSVGYKRYCCRRYRGYYGAFWGYPGYYPYASTQVLEVSLTMRDRKSQQVIHETSARYDRPWGDPRLVEALFDAALKDFPTPSAKRAVTVKLPERAEEAEEDDEPAAAAPPPADEKAKEAPKAPAAAS